LGVTSIVLGALSLFSWQWPNAQQWVLLLLMGGVDMCAQWSLSRALSLTQLTLLEPIALWRFVLIALSGILFFNEPFSLQLWIGVGLIIGMTVLILKKPGKIP
jgi:drug/metabolite transporter (DMT)-like permease